MSLRTERSVSATPMNSPTTTTSPLLVPSGTGSERMSTYSKTWFFAMSVTCLREGDLDRLALVGLVQNAVAGGRLRGLGNGALVLLLRLDSLGQRGAALDSRDNLLAASLGEARTGKGVSNLKRVNLGGLVLGLVGGLHRLSDGSQRRGQAVQRLKHLLEQLLLLFGHCVLLRGNVLRLPVCLARGARSCGLKHLNESAACARTSDDIDAQNLNEGGEDRRAVVTLLSGSERTDGEADIASHLHDDRSEALVDLNLGIQGTVFVNGVGGQFADEVCHRALGALELFAQRRVVDVNVSPGPENTGVVLKHTLRVVGGRALTRLDNLRAPTLAELVSR